jgi:RNA polymerase sigma factor (sigma-70 family)|tara:strand:+ start:747 stop:1517 length:771 start_codon:yes stop_codon:yes gene_type:complete
MKKFNVDNYNRHKADIKQAIKRVPDFPLNTLTREEIITKYMPMVEMIASKFSTSDTASGVLSINDLMQCGYIGLVQQVDKLDMNIINDSPHPEKTLKSFLAKRIKGTIRRHININRGDMKIPEWKLNELRGLDLEEDEYDPRVALFFSQVFQSTDEFQASEAGGFNPFDKPDNSKPYNIDILNAYLLGVMREHLNSTQYDVLRLSYGLDTPKMTAVDIAAYLDMGMATAQVRISQIKRDAIHTLAQNVSPEQIFEL